jgi:P27 family predicted phage terminase small subunit
MRGRRPKPTYLKLLEGNPGQRRLNENEPIPAGDLREPPEWFGDEQRRSWIYAVAHAPAGLLKCLDRGILVVWVVAECLHREAMVKVGEFGLLAKSYATGAPIPNPYLTIATKQAQTMIKAAAELGFTPASRSRVSIDPGASGRSKWDGLID